MIYFKFEMNNLGIVFKAVKQSKWILGNICDLIGQFENDCLLKIFLQLINAQDCFCYKVYIMFLENVS